MSAPSMMHWRGVQSILNYLQFHTDFGILFKNKPTYQTCIGYCDASYNSDPDTRRSVTGYCFLLYDSVISWKSKLQPTVALSTTEAEYMSINSAGREGVWIRKLIAEINREYFPITIHVGESVQPQKFTTTSKQKSDILASQVIFCDSTSAVSLVNNNYTSKETKHIDKTHHWAREQVELKRLEFKHIRGRDNISDVFTKNLPLTTFRKCRNKMGIVSLTTANSPIPLEGVLENVEGNR
jgi:hypothetical protein